jgi:hypothetical protein
VLTGVFPNKIAAATKSNIANVINAADLSNQRMVKRKNVRDREVDEEDTVSTRLIPSSGMFRLQFASRV